MVSFFNRGRTSAHKREHPVLKPAFESLFSSVAFESGISPMSGEIAEELGRLREHCPYWGMWLESQDDPPIGAIWEPHLVWNGMNSPPLWLSVSESQPELRSQNDFGLYFSAALNEEVMLRCAATGFDGCVAQIGELDRPRLQYLTEIARDLRLSLFWLISIQEDLERVLETDAPYVAFYLSQKGGEDAFCSQIRPCLDWSLKSKIPAAMRSLCLFSAEEKDLGSFLTRIAALGFDGYIDASRNECLLT